MSLLFVADVPLENPTSGSEQVLHQQAMGLASRGMGVYVIARHNRLAGWDVRGLNGIREGRYGIRENEILSSALSIYRFPSCLYGRFAQETAFDIAICHQPFNCFSLLARRKIKNLPMIYVFHSPSHEEYMLSHGRGTGIQDHLQARIRRSLERYCLRQSDRIMVLSHYMRGKVGSLHRMDPSRIVVNPGGADFGRFSPPEDRGKAKRELGLPEGKVHLLTVRNLEPRMGLDNLIKCMHLLRQREIAVHLTIGGEGEERGNIETLISEYSLSDDVTLKGFVPNEPLPEFYGAADFFVLPTRSLEGFGLVTIESMACGTPVLGTPIGGTKEILSGFGEEFLFRDASPEAMADGIQAAIERYLTDENAYDALRSRCRQYVENNYSWERHIDTLETLIEEMV